MKYKELRAPSSAEDSTAVRERVIAARKKQTERFTAEKMTDSNAQMVSKRIRKHCAIGAAGEKLLENPITRLGLSVWPHDRILKVAPTIADLDSSAKIEANHLCEATQYGTLDRSYWAQRKRMSGFRQDCIWISDPPEAPAILLLAFWSPTPVLP